MLYDFYAEQVCLHNIEYAEKMITKAQAEVDEWTQRKSDLEVFAAEYKKAHKQQEIAKGRRTQ
jgi:hypothetical protein